RALLPGERDRRPEQLVAVAARGVQTTRAPERRRGPRLMGVERDAIERQLAGARPADLEERLDEVECRGQWRIPDLLRVEVDGTVEHVRRGVRVVGCE